MKKIAMISSALCGILVAVGAQAMEKEGRGMGHARPGAMHRLDSDGDGKVSREEFLAGAEKAFERMDRNADGYVSREDRGRRGPRGRFSEFDMNDDGAVSLEEFVLARTERARTKGLEIPEEEIAARARKEFSRLDRNGDGRLDGSDVSAREKK